MITGGRLWRRAWVIGITLLMVGFVVAEFRPTHSTPKHVSLRIVRPDGQPLPPEESGDHEIVLASGCGVERWPVKTGADADRAKVSSAVIATSSGCIQSHGVASDLRSLDVVRPCATE